MGVTKTTTVPGDGSTFPSEGAKLTVHYTGRLESSDGKRFDSSSKRKPFSFQAGADEVIRGWDEGVMGMSLGEKATLTITPDFAYGSRGVPGLIPGGATLVFDMELLAIGSSPLATAPTNDTKVRPNGLCGCGSGKKFKKCCGGAKAGNADAGQSRGAGAGGMGHGGRGVPDEKDEEEEEEEGARYVNALRLAREAEARRVAEKKRARAVFEICGEEAARSGGGGNEEKQQSAREAQREALRAAKKTERDVEKEATRQRKLSAVYRDKGSDRKRRKGGA